MDEQLTGTRQGIPGLSISVQPSRRLVGLDHRGRYSEIGEAYARLEEFISACGLWSEMGTRVSVYFDDATRVPVDHLRSFAGFQVTPEVVRPEELVERGIEGGIEAVLVHAGTYAGLPGAYDQLFGEWLKASGYRPGQAPYYECYLNSPRDTAPEDLRTELHLPLERA